MSKETKTTTAVSVKKDEVMTEFIPFGAADAIKLSVAMVLNLLAVPTKSKVYPTANDCIKFIALCKARKLNPFEGDAYLIGYDTKDGAKFNLITAHQAFLKRAEVNKEYDGMESGIIVLRDGALHDLPGDFHGPDDEVVGGWATVFFKNRSKPMSKRLRLSRFKKPFGVWMDDPAGMICKCSEADALRSSFPTMLGGLYLREEVQMDTPTLEVPIFNAATPEPPPPAAARKSALPAPAPEPTAGQPVIEALRDTIKQADVLEADLVRFLQNIRMLDDKVDKFDDIPDNIANDVLTNWDVFEGKIKEALEV